ncbi:DUF6414 family protein [Enterococcus gilvus]|uniref:DUF6414 family protein n=1 Tax=Enterococcus gilvus TaxID=160453 RepID=UPI003ED9EBB2
MVESLKKIIYFDETSAVDLLQIERKGNFNKTIELINQASGDAKGEVKATAEAGKQSAVKTVFEKLSGLSGNIQGTLSASGTIQGDRIAKTILENSLLYDFLDTVEFRKRKPLLDISENYKLEIDKDSMTYYAMIAPIAEMLEGQQRIDEEVTMIMSKMNQGIRGMKGYYELIGQKTNDFEVDELSTRIFRFNIDSFKNNYRLQDLRRMKLTIYSIYVGDTKLSELNFETEFELDSKKSELDFKGLVLDEEEKDDVKKDRIVPVYDVILAGVK